jgi:segregation and condensation protein B
MRLTQIIEALLFASDAPLSAADLSRVDERLDEDTVEAVIQELRAEYELSERSFQIYEVAGGYQILTRPEFVTVLERYDSVPQPARLSVPALEVLAIIAYRQPIGRTEIEDIRGVGSSGVLRTLSERQLVEAVARGEGLGRPLLYGTTKKFMEHFGFRSLEDLPRPDELPVVLRERQPPEAGQPLTEPVTDAPAQSAAADEAATQALAEPPAADDGSARETGAIEPGGLEGEEESGDGGLAGLPLPENGETVVDGVEEAATAEGELRTADPARGV